ncbi:MAG: ribose 5-phosphate isomerase B [Spirochaetota bacterium]|nr:ribose 5-phosphate isomerase B [Spirochaetota bacterium]
MTIGIGSDHAGFKLKSLILEYFDKEGIKYTDFGTNSTESVDYPDFIFLVAQAVAEKKVDSGIVICGSGIGASIVANKIKGIRAARCENEYVARFSRQHNDANVLALGERVLGSELALSIVKVWLSTDFEGGRHQRRLDKIAELENNTLQDKD